MAKLVKKFHSVVMQLTGIRVSVGYQVEGVLVPSPPKVDLLQPVRKHLNTFKDSSKYSLSLLKYSFKMTFLALKEQHWSHVLTCNTSWSLFLVFVTVGKLALHVSQTEETWVTFQSCYKLCTSLWHLDQPCKKLYM